MRYRYLHSDSQNKVLKLMAFTMLSDITKNVTDNLLFSIIVDETNDNSNTEQLVVYIRQVDIYFEIHEGSIGIHAVDNIKPDILVNALKDTLIRLNIPLTNCCGQCYDDASNMTEIKRDVAKQIQSESALAFLTHRYGHALNLAVNCMIKKPSC